MTLLPTCITPLPMDGTQKLSDYEFLCWIQTNMVNLLTEFNNLTEAFNQLKTYVEVQISDENLYKLVNEKLTTWYQDGTLEALITKHTAIYFNTVTDMISNTKLTENNICVTKGYRAVNDNGNATYVITNVPFNEVDGGLCIQLENKLYANLITNGSINVAQYGAITANIEAIDVSPMIQNAINASINHVGIGTLVFNEGVYPINNVISITDFSDNNSLIIEGNNAHLYGGGTNGIFNVTNGTGTFMLSINNLWIDSAPNNSSTEVAMSINGVSDFSFITFHNILITGFNVGIKIDNSRHLTFTNLVIRETKGLNPICLFLNANIGFTGDMVFNGCEFYSATGNAIYLLSNGTVGVYKELRGIHFTDCYIYGGTENNEAVIIQSKGINRIADIFIMHCQFDYGVNQTAIVIRGDELSPSSTGLIANIIIDNCYGVNFKMFANILGTNNTLCPANIMFTNNYISCGTPINVYYCKNFKFINNTCDNQTDTVNVRGDVIHIINNNVSSLSPLPNHTFTLLNAYNSITKNNIGTPDSSHNVVESNLPASDTIIISDNIKYVTPPSA